MTETNAIATMIEFIRSNHHIPGSSIDRAIKVLEKRLGVLRGRAKRNREARGKIKTAVAAFKSNGGYFTSPDPSKTIYEK